MGLKNSHYVSRSVLTSSLLGQNIFLNIAFADTCNSSRVYILGISVLLGYGTASLGD